MEIFGKSRSESADWVFNLVRKMTYTHNSITRQSKRDTNSVILRIRGEALPLIGEATGPSVMSNEEQ